MSGYKRVNFYELCRFCARNREEKKVHIFEEDGRKMQLQAKIQACLAVKVTETDCLPKVVCFDCLRNLEESFSFRKRCISSERMLSAYFDNYRHTDGFKASGQVYIKEVESKEIGSESEAGKALASSQNVAAIEITQAEIRDKNSGGFEYVNIPLHEPCDIEHTPAADPLTARKAARAAAKLGAKAFPCKLCAKAFRRREHLYQHAKLHSGFRPFVCEHCAKSFVRKEHLDRHTTRHSGQRNFACRLCAKSFARKDILLKHEKMHDRGAGYKCKVCGRQFAVKHCYAAHKCGSNT